MSLCLLFLHCFSTLFFLFLYLTILFIHSLLLLALFFYFFLIYPFTHSSIPVSTLFLIPCWLFLHCLVFPFSVFYPVIHFSILAPLLAAFILVSTLLFTHLSTRPFLFLICVSPYSNPPLSIPQTHKAIHSVSFLQSLNSSVRYKEKSHPSLSD